MSERITVTIPNDLRCRLEGDFDDKALDDYFSFYTSKFWWRSKAAQRGMWDGKVHLYNKSSGVLPLGLLRTTKKWLKQRKIKYKINDNRISKSIQWSDITTSLGGNITLRPDQSEAVRKAVKMERGIIHGATGAGKTELAAAIIKTLGLPATLFLTGRKKLARQTRERFAIRLGVPLDHIGMIQGGKWLTGKSGVYIAVVDTLIQDKFAKERSELYNNVQLLFIDECHHSASASWYHTLMNCKARYRFGLTGTPVGRSDGADLKLRACTSGIIAKIRAVDLIEQGILSKPTIHYVSITKPKIFAVDETWSEIYRRGIVENEQRNSIIVRRVKELEKHDNSILILVKELDHGYRLKTLIKGSIFVHGGTPDEVLDKTVQLFECKKIKTLIATSIFDEGIDIPIINVLVLASGGKSQISTLQRVGRGMRKKGGSNELFVLDFIDRTNEHLLNHSLRRLEVCKAEGYSVKVVSQKDGLPRQFLVSSPMVSPRV